MKLGSYNGTAFTVSNSQIVLAPLASIEVRREDTGALASLFSDRLGASGISNPMTADAYGRFNFHAAGLEDGYRIRVTEAASPGLEYTLRYQKVGTAGELDIEGLGAGLALIAVSARGAIGLRPPSAGAFILNGKIARSVSGGALTIALKTLGDADPSGDSPVYLYLPTVTGSAFDGGYAVRVVTSALSLTVPAGGTVGHVSAVASPVYFYALWNGSAVKLAVSSKFFGGASVQSTLPVESSPSSTSATALYSDAVYSSVAVACIGRWKSTQTIAGTWAATTGEGQLYPFPYKAPTVTTLTSGTGTYSPPWDAHSIRVRMVGGGSGGAGSGTGAGAGSAAGNTTFGSLTANGGGASSAAGDGTYSTGGAASGGDLNISGQDGSGVAGNTSAFGGQGGSSVFGGAGLNSVQSTIVGRSAETNTGSGGSGASCSATAPAGAGGASGGYVEKIFTDLARTYAYSVGAGTAGGTAGTGGAAGGAGASGIIIVEEYYA